MKDEVVNKANKLEKMTFKDHYFFDHWIFFI